MQNIYMKLSKQLLAGTMAMSILLCTACGGGGGGAGGDAASSSASSVTAAQTYAGSGSDWRWDLNSDGTFHAQELETSVDIYGAYERLDSGFLRLIVSYATGPDAPSPGDEAYALEVPGVAMLVKPILAFEDEIITMVARGECPTGDFDANWIYTQYRNDIDYSNGLTEAGGVFHWDHATQTGSLPDSYSVASFASLGLPVETFAGTCDNGIMTITEDDGTVINMYLTANGSAVVKLPEDDAVFAVQSAAITSIPDLAGNYAGLLFQENADGTEIDPVSVTINADGTMVGVELVSVQPMVTSADSVNISIDAINSPNNGMMEAVVTDESGNTGNLLCNVSMNSADSGKHILSCTGQNPGDNSKPYNVLLVSQ